MLAAGLAGLGGVLVSVPPASAHIATVAAAMPARAASPRAVHVGARPIVPESARRIGLLPPRVSVHLVVSLQVRDQAALTSFIADLSDRRSPLFHHFLRPGQFGARFGPTRQHVARVDAALRSMGLVPGPVSRDRLAIPVQGSAAAAERAFAVTLVRYRLAGGRVAYANSAAPQLPAAIAPYVSAVLGLDSVNLPRSLVVRPASPPGRISAAARPRLTASTSGPQPCAAAAQTAQAGRSFTADQLASYYGMSPLYRLSDFGQGVHVALAEFESDSDADVSAYLSCYGLHTTVSYTEVNGGPPAGSGSGEAALDIQDLAGLAPDVTVNVYRSPNGGDADTYELYQAIVDAAKPDPVVSTSWGECELDDESLVSSEHALFEQAATQGQTVFAAAGDAGSTDCLRGGGANAPDLAVDDPGSQPYVVDVGGTSIGASQTVWNDSSLQGGAGGGGPSAVWCMPAYQDQTSIPGLISASYSARQPGCGRSAPYRRQVPDVSADADPYTGYTIYYGGWTAFGGTSAAAPLWAAVAALTDASPFCRDYAAGNAGVQPAGLYDIAGAAESYIYGDGEALSDITSGNNDYTPSGYTGGLYPATAGYDMASGLGAPLASGYSAPGVASNFYPGLTALMCYVYGTRNETVYIDRISPAAVSVHGGTTVTVTGSGFLPIPGADIAKAGSEAITASCKSTTTCTVELPSDDAGRVRVRMDVEDLVTSAPALVKRYSYTAPPAISSLSPRRGRARGGTRVIITGRNFVGKLAVRFGRKAARIASHSQTRIVVVAPAGSGTVTVKVTAAGGRSAATSASRYRY